MSEEIRYWVGFDWASEKHVACLLDAKGSMLGERQIAHDGAALAEFCEWLVKMTGTAPSSIAVAIETTHGPVVETLLERGFQVYAINPKQLDRFRDRFTVAGAKDDSRDAHVLADSLRTDARAFRRLRPEDPIIIELREHSRLHDDLTAELGRLTNRLREQLWRYFPQLIKVANGDLDKPWLLELWEQASTPAAAAKLTEKTVQRILKAHRIRRIDAAQIIEILRHKPMTVAAGAVEAAVAHITLLLPRIRLIGTQLKTVHRRLDQLSDKIDGQRETEPGQVCGHRDVEILRSMPGLGRIVLAAMLAEASGPLGQRDYHVLRAVCGQAPVTRRSGKGCVVLRRYACNQRLADTLYHWARVAMRDDPGYKQRYAELRKRGHSHGRALRTIGDHLLMVTCTLLKRQVPYDPDYKRPTAAAAA